ncbi:hypothetical protein [Galbibacter mesophilus]|uniref:hypothetical protein n=1 Tax=Galbibacter mesophilus TaxID=379069 RepID=UPI00191E7923|nr:hypothetical protein [Galbibacter mesophilus]MCM5664248.1 hypothetical protein [Galbibacter mesophilus]
MIESTDHAKKIKKNVIKIFRRSCKLKETYNECQYYMSHSELKLFYEESFFSANTLCNCLDEYVRTWGWTTSLISKFHNAAYITKLTGQLFFTDDEFKLLFTKALFLEEKNFEILKSLDKDSIPEEIKEMLVSELVAQEKRIKTLKSILKNHYQK